jgi:hypothetical protein
MYGCVYVGMHAWMNEMDTYIFFEQYIYKENILGVFRGIATSYVNEIA